MSGETLNAEVESWSYEELCGLSFKLIARPEYYVYDEATGQYTDLTGSTAGMEYLYDSKDTGTTLRISGIVRQNEDAVAGMMSGAIGYTSALTDRIIDLANDSEIVQAQLADPSTDAILGRPSPPATEPGADHGRDQGRCRRLYRGPRRLRPRRALFRHRRARP